MPPPLLAPFVALAAIAAMDLSLPAQYSVLALASLVPAMSNLVNARCRWIVVIGAVTFAASSLLTLRHYPSRPFTMTAVLITIVVMTVFSYHVRVQALAREQELRATRAVAETVQRTLLRPLPQRMGGVSLAAHYLAAAPEAHVGGDVYDAAWTPFGIRIMIGDVMGKGLGAVEVASALIGAFREAVFEEEKLPELAERLQVSLTRRADPNVFVTALFLTLPAAGDRVELISCGHPPPLLVTADGQASFVDMPRPCPPIGLLDLCEEHSEVALDLSPGDGLLLYTDGATEARDSDRRFFPLLDWAARPACWTLDTLVRDLLEHVGGDLTDDAALLLVRRSPVPV